MSVEASNKVLKIFGILDIIGGVLGVLGAVFLLIGAAALSSSGEDLGLATGEAAVGAGIIVLLGIVSLISGALSLVEGILSLRAVKDNEKIMPVWCLAIVAIVLTVISLIISLANSQGIGSYFITIACNILVFVAANSIKKSVGK